MLCLGTQNQFWKGTNSHFTQSTAQAKRTTYTQRWATQCFAVRAWACSMGYLARRASDMTATNWSCVMRSNSIPKHFRVVSEVSWWRWSTWGVCTCVRQAVRCDVGVLLLYLGHKDFEQALANTTAIARLSAATLRIDLSRQVLLQSLGAVCASLCTWLPGSDGAKARSPRWRTGRGRWGPRGPGGAAPKADCARRGPLERHVGDSKLLEVIQRSWWPYGVVGGDMELLVGIWSCWWGYGVVGGDLESLHRGEHLATRAGYGWWRPWTAKSGWVCGQLRVNTTWGIISMSSQISTLSRMMTEPPSPATCWV